MYVGATPLRTMSNSGTSDDAEAG
eukprot:COSAG02_NODE_27886_length_601_cov_0.509960_1_plen_23_part_10